MVLALIVIVATTLCLMHVIRSLAGLVALEKRLQGVDKREQYRWLKGKWWLW